MNLHEKAIEAVDTFDVLTNEEAEKLKQTGNCPFCKRQFVGYPTGWAWELHVREHLRKAGRLK